MTAIAPQNRRDGAEIAEEDEVGVRTEAVDRLRFELPAAVGFPEEGKRGHPGGDLGKVALHQVLLGPQVLESLQIFFYQLQEILLHI